MNTDKITVGAVTILPIDSIRLDGGTQPRANLDFDVVEEYVEAMESGAKFPPVDIFYDGSEYWLAHGFHRIRAADACENPAMESFPCTIHQGTVEDAKWFSYATNKLNGLHRSNEDKHRAVQAALAHPQGVGKSDHAIGEHVGVDHKTVAAWREKLALTREIPQSAKRTGRDGRTINVTNIGKNRPLPAPRPVVPPDLQATPDDQAPTGTGKRQTIIANAHKRSMIDVLSRIHGSCLGLKELKVDLVRTICSPDEIAIWAKKARDNAASQRKFARRLDGKA